MLLGPAGEPSPKQKSKCQIFISSLESSKGKITEQTFWLLLFENSNRDETKEKGKREELEA